MSQRHLSTAVRSILPFVLLMPLAGCDDPLDLPRKNKPPQIVAFSANPAEGDAPLTVQFASTLRGGDLSVRLDFGDGSAVSNDPNASHTYTVKGQYTAILRVRDKEGALAVAATGVTAGPLETVSFQDDIFPLFASTGCASSSCHSTSTRAGNLALSGNVDDVYDEIVNGSAPNFISRVDTATPCNSLLLKKPAREDCTGAAVSHGGGTLWPVGSDPYNRTETWISEGALDN